MNWRQWLYVKLATSSELLAKVSLDNIAAAGSIEGAPKERPFILIRVGDETPELRDNAVAIATSRTASIWVYDEPGSYDLIDEIIDIIKSILQCEVERSLDATSVPTIEDTVFFSGGTQSIWENDSLELADDVWSAITRNTNYRLVGAN